MQEVFEKIIEKLEECKDIMISPKVSDCFEEECKYNDCTVCAFAKAIEIVKQEAEKNNNGWIPCDGVHFPEENVYVRVTTWTETEKIGFRRDGKWFVYGSDGMAEATVLAWQPTQPYQPKGE